MKLTRKLFGLTLSLALLFCTLAFPAQAAAKTCNCGIIPIVSIPGIGDTLYCDFGTPEQREAGVVSTDGLQDVILPVAKDIIAAVATQSWDKGADALTKLCFALFGHLQVDEHGKSVQNVSRLAVYEDKDHKTSRHYDFRYDWRLDPMENGKKLNAYIQQVKAGTGHKQVILQPYSEGGCVALAYLAQFGCGDIEHFVPIVSAHNGLTLVGELFNKNVELGADIAVEYMRSFGRVNPEGGMRLLAPAADVLQQSGIADALVDALSVLLDHVGDKLFSDALIPLFVQWPALWGFVPDEYYESAKKLLLDDPKYKDFIKLIDNYHYKAGPGMADQIIARTSKKTKVSILTAYGFPTQPFTKGVSSLDADGLIDTARESCGATTAGLGRTFPAGYKQKVNDGHNHISPDRRVDASTCLLPDQTWFVKDMDHFHWNYGALKDFLFASKKQPTVFSDPKFPQFMTRLPDGAIVPTVPEAKPAAALKLPGSMLDFTMVSLQLLWEAITG